MNSSKFLLEPLNSILIGIILGDGAIRKTSIYKNSNSRLEMSFGTKYKEYAESISLLFSDFIKTPLKEIKIKGKNKVYINYRLKTISQSVFNSYFDLFYYFDEEKNFRSLYNCLYFFQLKR